MVSCGLMESLLKVIEWPGEEDSITVRGVNLFQSNCCPRAGSCRPVFHVVKTFMWLKQMHITSCKSCFTHFPTIEPVRSENTKEEFEKDNRVIYCFL